MTVHISVVVSRHSRIIESTLLSIQETVGTLEEAAAFQHELDLWMEARPGNGKPIIETDLTTKLADQLFDILERDPEVFGPFYDDFEHRSSMIERRPYDIERLEVA